jgi:hypothetical protein
MNRFRLTALAGVVAAFLVAPAVAQADVIGQWNSIAQTETVLLRPTAHGETRGIAMVEGAVYDAVNAIDRGYQPYLVDPEEVAAQPWDSQDAAARPRVSRAARDQAGHPPSRARRRVRGDAARHSERADEAGRHRRRRGSCRGDARVPAGRRLPGAVLTREVGNEKPFLIESPSQFRSEGPNALTSDEYTREFNEVKELGALNSTERTDDQTKAAVFWQFAPIALWNTLARVLADRYHLDAADQARLYAMINLASADGAIACWNDKYYWNFWRPRAAIREADTDGNPATFADPSWEPLFSPATPTTPPLVTPPFPDHPSGHGCASGAVLNTFADFFGTDKVEITVVSGRSLNGVPIPPRHFDRLSQALKEIIDARVWGGIHFRTADVQGAVIGEKVAHYLRKHYFQPVA